MKNPLTNQRILFDCCSALFVTVGSLGRGGLDIGISKARAVRGPTKNLPMMAGARAKTLMLTTAKPASQYVRTYEPSLTLTLTNFVAHGRILADHAPMAKMRRRETQIYI